MAIENENLKKAKEHFLTSQQEFLLSLLYMCRYVKDYFHSNGRGQSPIAYLADAGEMVINSILLLIPFDGNEHYESLKDDARLLLSAIENIQREYARSGVPYEPGSMEYRMMELLKRVAEMLGGENSPKGPRPGKTRVVIE